MKRLSTLLLCTFSLSIWATPSQFAPQDLVGSWKIKTEGYNEMRPEATQKFDEIKDTSSALILMLFSLRLDVTESQVSYAMDEKLMHDTLKQPTPNSWSIDVIQKASWKQLDNEVSFTAPNSDGKNKTIQCPIHNVNHDEVLMKCYGDDDFDLGCSFKRADQNNVEIVCVSDGETHEFSLERI